MHRTNYLLIPLCILMTIGAYGQSGEVDRLKKALQESEEKSNYWKKEAEANMARAVAAEKEANRLRYLSIARDVAIRSTEVEDKDLSTLLAIQSNTLHKNFGGYPYDDQIYNALFKAVKDQGSLPKDLSDPTQPSHSLIGIRKGTLYSIGLTGEVVRWTQSNDEWMSEQVLVVHMDVPYTSIEVSPDARHVLIGRPTKVKGNSQAELYELGTTQKDPTIIGGFKSKISKVIFTPDGSGFYALHNDGNSIAYSNMITTKDVATTKEPITAIALSTDGTRLTGAGKNTVYVWNTHDFSRSEVALPDSDIQLTALDFLRDQTWKESRIVAGDRNGFWWIIDSSNGLTQIIRKSHISHGAAIQQIAFSPDGKFMATAANNETLQLWNIARLQEPPIRPRDVNCGGSLSFSPDGRQVLYTPPPSRTQTQSTISRVYLNLNDLSDQFCRRLKRNLTKDEWEDFFQGLPYERTCEGLPANNK